MQDVMVLPYNSKRKKSILQKWWMVPLIVTLLFIFSTVGAYATYVIQNNLNFVGLDTNNNVLTVGNPTGVLLLVGLENYSTNETSNNLAQTILPILAVVIVIGWAFKSLVLESGLGGFMRTAVIFVIGAAMLGTIIAILQALT